MNLKLFNDLNNSGLIFDIDFIDYMSIEAY